jgi:hypothetical protein
VFFELLLQCLNNWRPITLNRQVPNVIFQGLSQSGRDYIELLFCDRSLLAVVAPSAGNSSTWFVTPTPQDQQSRPIEESLSSSDSRNIK